MRWTELEHLTSENSHLFARLFEASPEPSLIMLNDQFIECNEAALSALGYSEKREMIDIHPSVISPERQPDGELSIEKAERMIRLAEAHGIHQFEWTHQTKLGKPVPVRVTLLTIKTSIGLIIYCSWNDLSEKYQLHKCLTKSELRFRSLFNTIHNGVVFLQPDAEGLEFIITDINNAGLSICGQTKDNLLGRGSSSLFPAIPENLPHLKKQLKLVWEQGRPRQTSLYRREREQIQHWIDIDIYKLSTHEMVMLFNDNTANQQNQISLELYANVYRHSRQAILISDENNNIISVNSAFSKLTGYSEQEVIGKNPRILSSGRVSKSTYLEMWNSIRKNDFWQGELWDRTKNGAVYPKWISISVIRNREEKVVFYIASFSDISEMKEAEQKIYNLAHHDPLTELLNRFSLEERLKQAIQHAKRNQSELAVLFIDLDRFKDINDSLGHHIGDKLLKLVAKRLIRSVRGSDIVARLGGDEFIVVLTNTTSPDQIAAKTNRIQQALSQPYLIDKYKLNSTPSIGISIFPHDGKSAEELMKNADTSMYHAKESGRNNFQFFSRSLSESTQKRLQLEHDLNRSLERGEFELYYQPQITADTNEICALEALIRWHHPKEGLIPPYLFIPILEENGMIEQVGEWVLDQACSQIAQWRNGGIEQLRVAINLSARQLRSPELITLVKSSLQQYHLSADALELEITETVAMEDPEQAIEILKALRSIGLTIAIDDFGTGYSSLAYLKQLPIEILKLDREFVRDIESDPNDAAISSATIALAHNMGLKVIAEGVETEAQSRFLLQHDCDFMQGFLYGKPEPAQSLTEKWLAKGLLKH